MLDKTILVFYVNVGNMEPGDVSTYMSRLKEQMNLKPEDNDKVLCFFIPIRNEATKVECLNVPTVVATEKQLNKYLNKLGRVEGKLDRITAAINATAEKRRVITEKHNEKC